MIKTKVLVNQPRLKADNTGTISVSTLLEMQKSDYEELNTAKFDKEEYFMILVRDEEYLDFIITEGNRLLTDKPNNNE